MSKAKVVLLILDALQPSIDDKLVTEVDSVQLLLVDLAEDWELLKILDLLIER